jgi:hypothetical protein
LAATSEIKRVIWGQSREMGFSESGGAAPMDTKWTFGGLRRENMVGGKGFEPLTFRV